MENNTDDDLKRFHDGDDSALNRLIARALKRLRRLASHMLRSYPGVSRWEETDDIMSIALIRLSHALKDLKKVSKLESSLHFYRLAALQIRRELIDLAKRYNGPQGMGAKHETVAKADHSDGGPLANLPDDSEEPSSLEAWSNFHEAVGLLPVEEREVVELIWYQGFTHEQVAKDLGVSIRTVRRRWQSARLKLAERLGGAMSI